jgi:hypothetical protein
MGQAAYKTVYLSNRLAPQLTRRILLTNGRVGARAGTHPIHLPLPQHRCHAKPAKNPPRKTSLDERGYTSVALSPAFSLCGALRGQQC